VKGESLPARRRGQEEQQTRTKPATTIEERENQLIYQAIDLAEKQIQAGTASSQVITHYLKLGSTREVLEKQRLEHENELTRVKIEAMESVKRTEELYGEAIKAMKRYSGQDTREDPDDPD
jgi:hypothetical protein